MTLKEEKELLLRVVIQLATKLIGVGGFVPFGATLGPGRKAKVLYPKAWKDNVSWDELKTDGAHELKRRPKRLDLRLQGSCADVRIPMDTAISPSAYSFTWNRHFPQRKTLNIPVRRTAIRN